MPELKNKISNYLFGALLAGVVFPPGAADRSAWDAILDTLPAGALSAEDRTDSYVSDSWSGFKKIFFEGTDGLILPAYTIHPGWAYKTPKRRNENGYTWGGGVTRNFIDDRGNRRIVYAMAFSDSHSNIEPFLGYGWLSRWRLGNSDFYAEAGYTLGITARGDYKWIPFPAPLPLLGFGTDAFSIYGTYVPFSNIFFFFANYATDAKGNKSLDFSSNNLFSNRFLIYAGGGYQKNDMKGMPHNATTTSEGAYSGGIRFFVTPHWALDFGITQSAEQKVRSQGRQIGSFKLRGYQLTAQYHMQASDSVKLYAGIGAGYFRLQGSKFEAGTSYHKGDFSPVVQAGGTYAITKNLHITGGVDLAFPRYETHTADSSYSMRPSPATFKIAVGLAF